MSKKLNRSECILEGSFRPEKEALWDRALLWVDEAVLPDFQARLDRPAAPNERLRKTMHAAIPWEGE